MWFRRQVQPSRRELLNLSLAEVEVLKQSGNCTHCGGYHVSACPYIKTITHGGETITFHERFADLIDTIIYDTDLDEAEQYYAELNDGATE